jgi:hypothetical protein
MDAPECPGCRDLSAQLAQAEARILALEGMIRELLDKLKPPPGLRPVTPQPPAPRRNRPARNPAPNPATRR